MNKELPLVTCIVPVYNAENYLRQTVESLLSQTYKNIEIILVDDRSTDNSWLICCEYQSQDGRIQIYQNSKNTGGPLRGRELGIKKARGEWLTFIDCDDYVSDKYIEHLVDATCSGRYDIAVTGHARLHPDGTIMNFGWKDYHQTTRERIETFFDHFMNDDFWTDPTDTVGQNLIRTSIAKKTNLSLYPNNIWAEDTLMALAFLSNSENGVNFVDNHDFYWRQREGSGSHGGFSSRADRHAFYRACYDIFSHFDLLPLVSIVVPIYNVQDYLEDCLKSLIAQSYPNIQIILVDDAATDGSGQIADRYADQYEYITVIHKNQNEGLNMARASGFRKCTGEYVMFVDSDDLIVADCVSMALKTLRRNSCNFVRFGMRVFGSKRELDDIEITNRRSAKHEIILDNKRDLLCAQLNPEKTIKDIPALPMTVWGCLYTTKSVHAIDWKVTNYRIYEDNIWTLKYLEYVTCGVYSSYIGYCYRQSASQRNTLSQKVTGNAFNSEPVGYLEFLDHMWKLYDTYNQKFDTQLKSEINERMEYLYIFRLGQLIEQQAIFSENNEKYLQRAIAILLKRFNTSQYENRELQMEIDETRKQHDFLQNEIREFLSIKRSAKLTLGNIKRRINRSKEE